MEDCRASIKNSRDHRGAAYLLFLLLPHATFTQGIFEASDSLNRACSISTTGRYSDAEPLYKQSLAIREKVLSTYPEVAAALNNLALLYQRQGRYSEAEPLYKRSLDQKKKAFGPDHPDMAGSLNNLADLYPAQGHYADAEPLFKRSLAIHARSLGPDHANIALR